MKKLVITGNYSEYKEVCKNLKINYRKDAVYVNSPKRLKGRLICSTNILFEGTYEKRKNIREIIACLGRKIYFHNRFMKSKIEKIKILPKFFRMRTFWIAITIYVIMGLIYINTK